MFERNAPALARVAPLYAALAQLGIAGQPAREMPLWQVGVVLGLSGDLPGEQPTELRAVSG